jgi:hypothetical protein
MKRRTMLSAVGWEMRTPQVLQFVKTHALSIAVKTVTVLALLFNGYLSMPMLIAVACGAAGGLLWLQAVPPGALGLSLALFNRRGRLTFGLLAFGVVAYIPFLGAVLVNMTRFQAGNLLYAFPLVRRSGSHPTLFPRRRYSSSIQKTEQIHVLESFLRIRYLQGVDYSGRRGYDDLTLRASGILHLRL